MTETELEDITGVGPAVAEALETAGLLTVEDVAQATEAELEAVGEYVGTPTADLISLAAPAQELLDAHAATPETESTETTVPDAPTSTLTVDAQTYRHFLHGLLEFRVQAEQRTEIDDKQRADALIEQFIEAGPVDAATDISFTADMAGLNILDRAASAMLGDLRARSGTIAGWGELGDLISDVNDLRRENWNGPAE